MQVGFGWRTLPHLALIVCVGADRARLIVEAVVPRLIPDRPHGNANRCRMVNSQMVVAVVGSEGSAGPQTSPETNRLPVVALRILSNRLRIRRTSVRVSHQRCRF